MERTGQNQRRRICFVEFARWLCTNMSRSVNQLTVYRCLSTCAVDARQCTDTAKCVMCTETQGRGETRLPIVCAAVDSAWAFYRRALFSSGAASYLASSAAGGRRGSSVKTEDWDACWCLLACGLVVSSTLASICHQLLLQLQRIHHSVAF